MFTRNRLFYIKLGVIFIGVVLLLISFYTYKLKNVIEKNTLIAINETAIHDKRAIKTCIEFFLDELSGIEKRLAAQGCDTILELEKRLNLERSTTSFTRIFMLAENGKIYTDKFLIYEPGQNNLGSRFNFNDILSANNANELVFRFDDNAEFAGISRESILYAIKMNNFSVAGEKMVAIIGFTDIHFLQEHMIIDCFVQNGVAYGTSSIIDDKGEYIVGRTKDVYLANDGNFFNQFIGSKCSLPVEEIRRLMRKHATFSFYITTAGGERLVYLVPFGDGTSVRPDWYFIMEVNNDYMRERQATFSLLSLSLLGIVIVVLLALMLYAIFTRNRLHMAGEAVRVRSEFLSSMSHEIRTPLNGLIGLNHLITVNIDNPDKKRQIRDWLVKSKSLADYLLALLNDILDMSKLQAGKIDIINEPFSISAMLDDVILMQSANAEKRGLSLELEKELSAPCIIGDQMRIKQVLTNIIGNAVKFTPQGGSIRVKASQHVSMAGTAQTVFICQDTGIGMSQEFLARIFDPFSQDESGQSAASLKGTGLGMPICKEIVSAMRGSIAVESRLGEGSKFTVSINNPVAECAGESSVEDPGAGEHAGANLSGKILLAEDAEFNAEFLIELLEEQGFVVAHARNGEEAVDIFKNSAANEFSVILMDMQMPVMDGCQASRIIRNLARPDAGTVKIYACTANTFREDMDRAMASGMDDFLTKPIDIKMFLNKIGAQS